MPISYSTLAVGSFIVISATFVRQLWDFSGAVFGRAQTESGLVVLIGLLALGVFAGMAKTPISLRRKLCFFALFCLGLYISWQQRLFPERMHMIEYGLLGWMAARDFLKERADAVRILKGLAVVLVFACLDELLQGVLPYRTGDLRDICFNLAGGLAGITLFFIKSGKNFYLDRRR